MISNLNELNKLFNAEGWLSENYGCEFVVSGNGWLNACCPFEDHSDSSPSFGINLESGWFSCFGCSRSGSFIQMIVDLEKVNFYRAVGIISEYSGIDVNNIDSLQWKLDRFKKALSESDNTEDKNKITAQKATMKIKKIMKVDFDKADEMYKELDEMIEVEDYKGIKDKFLNG